MHVLFEPELQPKLKHMDEVQNELVGDINSGAIYRSMSSVDKAMDTMEDLLLAISKKNDLLAFSIAWGAYMGAAFSAVKRGAPMRITKWMHFGRSNNSVKEDTWE